MKKYIPIILLICVFISFVFNSIAQDGRQQLPGKAKGLKSFLTTLKGEVRSKESSQLVPNADLTLREASSRKIINRVKTGPDGIYEVSVPKGMDLIIKAQAPQYFYDTKHLSIGVDESKDVISLNFMLPSELQLRLNFPSNKHADPYKFILDENGEESQQSWQSAIEQLAEDLIKYKDYIKKVKLVGHTDDVGNKAYNVKLAQRRAEFVMNELIKRGVSNKVMELKSAGKSELLDMRPNEKKDAWRKRCRRVVMSKVMKK